MSRPSIFDLDPVEFGNAIAPLIQEIIQPLKNRIGELEIEKNIDVEVINELASCLERVGALEKTSGGRGIRFMGRWNRDVDFLPGDIVQHGAALWISKRATRETPGGGIDWQRMLKADQRGGFRTGDDE
jgi:hypothetical protein